MLISQLPYRERLWSQLMLGLYQAGRVEEALAAYRRAREVLLDTLGLEPGPLLRELQQRILDQDPTLAPPPPPRLVVGPTGRSVRTPKPHSPRFAADFPTPSSRLRGRPVSLWPQVTDARRPGRRVGSPAALRLGRVVVHRPLAAYAGTGRNCLRERFDVRCVGVNQPLEIAQRLLLCLFK